MSRHDGHDVQPPFAATYNDTQPQHAAARHDMSSTVAPQEQSPHQMDGNDTPRQGATTPGDRPEQKAATRPDMPRPAAAGLDLQPADDRYVKALERENEFLRDQVSRKDTQIEALTKLSEITNSNVPTAPNNSAPTSTSKRNGGFIDQRHSVSGGSQLENDPSLWYHQLITRTQAIAIITAKTEATDDHTLEAVAAHLSTLEGTPLTVGDVLASFPTETGLTRDLTSRERDLIEQSKADFAAGRTYSTDEVFAHMDTQRAARRAAHTKA